MSARSICKVLTILAASALVLAGYWSVRLAWADALFRANTADSVRRATEIDAGNAAYHAWLAEIQEHDGLDPSPELERAAKLNPNDSAVWIRLGLRAESERDFQRAEQWLLQAAAIDKLFAPRWALANYYARRGDTQRFWPWARQAFDMGYGDLSPLFRLCWNVSDDPAEILARAIPPQREALGKYLAFLTREDRLEAAGVVAPSLIAQAGPADTPIALAYCDRLIERQRGPAAVAVWNALCARGLVLLSPLDPDQGRVLTNGDFRYEPLQVGFDWRIPAEAEISVTRSESPAAVRFQFSGKQPEHCELLSQFIPLTPGRKYTLRFDGKASRTPSGVRWRIGELAESPEFAGEDWTLQQVTFASASASLARLALVYDRAPGAVRSEGEIWLRNASVAFAK